MNIRRFVLLLFISYITFDLSLLVHLLSNSDKADFGDMALIVFSSTIIFIVGIISMQSIVNIFKFVYWVLAGYKNNVVMIFPFLIHKDSNKSKYRISLVYDVTRIFDTFFPGSFIEYHAQNYETKKVKNNIIACELYGIIIQLIIYCIVVIGIWHYDIIYLLPSVILFILSLVSLMFLKTVTYHGAFIKILNIVSGKEVYYLADSIILFLDNYNDIYRNFENKLNMVSDEDFLYYKIKILNHMFMVKCKNNFELSPSTEDFISQNIIDAVLIDFTKSIGSERWDFFKTYMCCALIHKCNDDLNKVLDEMGKLYREQGIMKIGELIQWYILIGRHHRITNQDEKWFKNKVIRMNGLNMEFSNYSYICNHICKSIKIICKK